MNASSHLNQAIFDWQETHSTNQLPKTVIGTPREIEDLERDGAIPAGMAIVYSKSDFPVLRVE